MQACRRLREEGYRVILINSNPATIMTDPATADVTYIEPITRQTVEKIIARSEPRRHPAHHGRADRAELRRWTCGATAGAQYHGRADRRHARGHRQGRRPFEVQGTR